MTPDRPSLETLINDLSVSYPLKAGLLVWWSRDPLDAANDAAAGAGPVTDGSASEAPASGNDAEAAAAPAAVAADTEKPAEEAPKPRARRRKPAAEAEDTAPTEPVADAAV